MKKMNKKGQAKGFTLTELVIVIVIIAILAAVLIPSMTGYVNRAKKSNATSEASSVYTIYAAWLADTAANYGYESVKQSDLKEDSGKNTNLYINGLTFKSRTATVDYEITKATIKTSDTDGTLSSTDIQYYTDSTETGVKVEVPTPAQVIASKTYEWDTTNKKLKVTTSGSTTTGEMVSKDRAYLDSFAHYYAQANDTKAYDGKNVDNNGKALVNVNKLTFVSASKTSFVMYSSNNFLIKCDISSGSPVYSIADSASVPEANPDLNSLK